MIVAAVSWKLRRIESPIEFFVHLEELVAECHSLRAELAVFPECISLESCHLYPDAKPNEIAAHIAAHDYAEFAAELASKMGMTLIAGSTLSIRDRAAYNEAIIATKDGRILRQTKNVLTQFEANEWMLSPGACLHVFGSPKIGVTICYDAEFPESGRALVEAGVLVQCVPAFTETVRGFQRVRWCCLARATENQNFVIHSSLVGSLGAEPVPIAVGSSAIIAPSIEPFPEQSVLAETAMDEEGVAVAEIDFELLAAGRQMNDVRNFADRKKGDWSLVLQPPE